MANIPTLQELVLDPQKRKQLTDIQYADVIKQMKQAIKGLGRPAIPLTPAQFAQKYSNAEWRPAKHLDYISSKLEAVEKRSIRRLLISCPPRHGKSYLVDWFFPAWWLTRHPKDRIILAGYGEQFARTWGGRARDTIIEYGDDLNILVNKERTAADDWELTSRGGMLSVGVGGAIMGRGANLLIIDDPIKSEEEANSETYRQKMWDWWQTTAYTRLEPDGVVVGIMCMTGDTPVLRPDGTETPLRNLRPGDEIATYEDGRIATAIVRNWASQGLDSVYEIKTKSGRIARANARHPFRVIQENGEATWVRLESLRVGMKVRCVGAPTPGSSVLSQNAQFPLDAKECACLTTGKPVGPLGTVHLPLPILPVEQSDSRGVMESHLISMTNSLKSRAGAVLSAEGAQTKSAGLNIGVRASASIMATIPEMSEDSSATTVISSLPVPTQCPFCKQLLNIWSIGADEIVEITEAGVEEVFDIEVDRTHNFIANGLEVSNTRWHQDDLFGRIIESDEKHEWEVINIPAEAENNDVLGRLPGEWLWLDRFPVSEYEEKKRTLNPWWWASLYQQRPTPAGGGLIQRDWFQWYHTLPEDIDQWIQSWDLSLKDKKTNDPSVGQVWCRKGANCYLVDSVRGHFTMDEVINHMIIWSRKYPRATAKLVEDTAMGPILKQTIAGKVTGVIPVPVKGTSKRSRVENTTPFLQGHNVWLPTGQKDERPRWVLDFVEECAAYPKATNDDQVDTFTQAIAYLQPAAFRKLRSDARAAAAEDNMLTPSSARAEALNNLFDKARKKAARLHNSSSRRPRMW